MYKIGQFSKITKISSHILRYYDSENVLKPSFVDSNGYRFYTDAQVEVINKIKYLRKYHFSYDEIKNILSNNKEEDKDIYLKKLEELKNSINDYDTLISELECEHKIKITPKIINKYDIQILEKKAFKALCKKIIIKEDEIETFIDKITMKIINSNVSLLGGYYIKFLENKDLQETYLEIEFCQPIAQDKEIKGFEIKSFENTLCIGTVHYGGYESIHQAYVSLYKFASDNNYKIIGSFMEKYYVDAYFTPYSNEFITEISVDVSK